MFCKVKMPPGKIGHLPLKKIKFQIVHVRLLLLAFLCSSPVTTLWAQESAKEHFELPEGYQAERDVTYSVVDGYENKLDIYWKATSPTPQPLIIWIHGGGWRSGDKRSARFARELRGQGYAVASINYRLSGVATFPAQVIDCKAAVRWLRANAGYYHINPEKFAAWGGSAGSHLAALLGTAEDVPEWEKGNFLEYSSRVQAVVDWFGPIDFSKMNDSPGKMDHLAADSPESRLIGGAVKDNPELVAYANPISYVNKHNPPFQIYHGKNDSLVLPNQAILLNEAFQTVGLTPDFALFDNTGHGGSEWNNYIPRARDFLDKHLKNSNTKILPLPPEPKKRWVHQYITIPARLQYHRFYAKTIRQDYGYMIYLPPSYGLCPKRRYPVIYWLPGRGGNPAAVNHFAELYHKAISDKQAPEAIIVGVSGINSSMYTNDIDENFPVETVIMNDLLDHIDQAYRTLPVPEMRAIDGFSMGGFGAARLGLKYPETFGVVSVVGAALHKPEFLKDERQDIFQEVFNGNTAYCNKTSPWEILENYRPLPGFKSKMRLAVGGEDMLLDKNRLFHQRLQALGIEHEFKINHGAGHNYPKVYANWEGNPFDFYLNCFGVNLGIEKYDANQAKNRPEPDYVNVAYGPHRRQVLDFWKARSDRPTPLVIFIHGGGFRQGDKSIVYNHELNELLHAGISVASINYRFYAMEPLPTAFHDGKRALQFLRTKAKEWNFDKEKIGVFGGSAGAQISMWLAYHDDMAVKKSKDPVERESTRILFAGSKGGQITMDPDWWRKHIPGYNAQEDRLNMIDAEGKTEEEIKEIFAEMSCIKHISHGDPVVYTSYGNQHPDDPFPLKKSKIGGWQAHNVVFGVELQKLAKKYDVPVILSHHHANTPVQSIVDLARIKFQ